MAIELKNLIDEACRRLERNFSAGDAAKLVNDYYASDVLIVGEGEFFASMQRLIKRGNRKSLTMPALSSTVLYYS
jgi:hypothetical protein